MKRRVTVALKRARADSDRSVLIGVSVGKEWLTTRNPERPSVSLSAFRAAESYKKRSEIFMYLVGVFGNLPFIIGGNAE